MQSSIIANAINSESSFDDYEDCLKATPTIPLSVYENLPPILFESCQVFKNVKDFNQFMEICMNSKALWGNKFTYTLLNENDFN